MSKFFYVSLESFDKAAVTAAIESGASAVIVPDGHNEEIKKMGKIQVIAKDGDLIFGKDIEKVKITKKEDEAKIVNLNGRIPAIIENLDWTIIPLENLISKTTNLVQSVKNEQEAHLAFNTMEKGADGVCLVSNNINTIKQVGKLVQEMGNEKLSLVPAEITEIKPVEMSDRCCMDTTSLLPPGTGMLVGDSAKAMFLVHNENVQSLYCDPRPFRVNAGAVHAYIRLPNNKTKYLCEISAGDSVLGVDPKGNTITIAVGRNKIERRPMLLVKGEYEGKQISLILQNAETIRLTSPEGNPTSVTTLKKGDKVLAFLAGESGRHFGSEVKETITEK